MALIAKESGGGGSFTPVPPGMHLARCYRIIDLGTQESTYQGTVKKLPKVMLQFEVHGEEVVFYDHALGRTKPSDAPHESPYDTPENRAIVADVVANYDTLEAEYEAQQKKIADNNAVYTKLIEIDQKSIRGIREWIALQPTAEKFIKDLEAEATAEREKLA